MSSNGSNPSKKRILVIGGTGAQGFAVVSALLSTNLYTIRVLSRDPSAPYVRSRFASYPEVEFHQGSFMDFSSVRDALKDCYGVYVNTDGFTVNEMSELWAGVRIWEVANTIPGLTHYIYASIDYYLQLTGWDERYAAHHTNGKGRVNSYLKSQQSGGRDGDRLTWTILNTGAYNEDLFGGPLLAQIDDDGTRRFKYPLGEGHIPFLTLSDTGKFAVAVFADREKWSGKELNLVSQFATGKEIAAATEKVSGHKAEYENVDFETWAANLGEKLAHAPVASTDPSGITVKENFKMWWPGFQDSVLLEKGTRDLEGLKDVLGEELETLEGWMRRVEYDGTGRGVLKGWVDAGVGPA